jgi:hypothetical protein
LSAYHVTAQTSGRYDVRLTYFNYNFISQTRDFQLPKSTIHFLGIEYKTTDFEVFKPGGKNDFASGFQSRISGFYAIESPAFSNLNVQDLYYQHGVLAIGRKVYRWSLLDHIWRLGIIEPQYRARSFVPVEQGLVGLFLDIPISNHSTPLMLHVFASPIFFPDQGPGYLLEDGRFIAQNPWFLLPPTEAYVSKTGVTDNLKYNVEIPSINRIVFNSSFGGMLVVGDFDKSGFYSQFGSFSKPNNQLSTGAKAFLQGGGNIGVDIFPELDMQQVSFVDVRYRFENRLAFHVGALMEKNEALRQNVSITRVTLAKRALGHISMSQPLDAIKSELRASLLQPLIRDEFIFSGNQVPELGQILISQKWPSSILYQIELNHRLGHILYRQSPQESFELIAASLEFPYSRNIYFTAMMELLKAPSQKGFYTKYANLDWAHLGFGYVF